MSPATRPRDLPPTLGMTLVEGGAEFAVYAGHADSVEVCLFDAGRHGRQLGASGAPHRAHPRHLVRLPPGCRVRASATACGPTGRGAPPRACATTRPSCCSTPTPAPSRATSPWTPEVFAHRVDERLKGDDLVRSPTRQRGVGAALRGGRRGLRLGRRRAAAHPAGRDRHLRGPRAQPHDAAPRGARAPPRHVCRSVPPVGHRPPQGAGRHRGRAAPGAGVHVRARGGRSAG